MEKLVHGLYYWPLPRLASVKTIITLLVLKIIADSDGREADRKEQPCVRKPHTERTSKLFLLFSLLLLLYKGWLYIRIHTIKIGSINVNG